MLQESKLKTLIDYLSTLTHEETIWVNGYLSGMLSNGKAVTQLQPAVAETKPVTNKITIAYGTETGNSKKLASEFASKAKKNGINVKVISLDQYRLNDLPKEEYFLTIISTQGEGEPPAAAKKLYDHIHNNGFKLDKLKYGVLALGDTSYPLFCKAGEDVDQQLNRLGGERLVPVTKCDVDYQADAEGWFEQVMHQLTKAGSNGATTTAPAGVSVVAKKSTG